MRLVILFGPPTVGKALSPEAAAWRIAEVFDIPIRS
jgi:hypothetical protein